MWRVDGKEEGIVNMRCHVNPDFRMKKMAVPHETPT